MMIKTMEATNTGRCEIIGGRMDSVVVCSDLGLGRQGTILGQDARQRKASTDVEIEDRQGLRGFSR